jgi:hypothetical protein
MLPRGSTDLGRAVGFFVQFDDGLQMAAMTIRETGWSQKSGFLTFARELAASTALTSNPDASHERNHG